MKEVQYMEKRLAMNLFRPQGEAKAAVFVVHGMEEHRKRYEWFARTLADHGIAVMTYDLPGHGESIEEGEPSGWFGAKDGWKWLVESSVQAALYMKRHVPEVPLWYFGHSMGTMIGRCFLQENDTLIDGMILSGAPAYNQAAPLAKVLAASIRTVKGGKGHSKMLDNLMTGSFNKGIENPQTSCDWISYNQENVRKYVEDPLCGDPFTIQGYMDLVDGMEQMNDVDLYLCSVPDLPIWFLSGQDDPCRGGDEGFNASMDEGRLYGCPEQNLSAYAS
jgi:alpha-beta hydrolase superfamily lysophospholipase